MTPREFLLISLLDIRKDPIYKEYGICSNLGGYLWEQCPYPSDYEQRLFRDSAYELLAQLMRSWPKYSGDSMYPVPGPVELDDPIRAYNVLDAWEGEYGDLRRELLDFMINELEKEE